MIGMKVWAYVVLAGVVITAGWTAYNKIYDAGYNEAVVEMIEKQQLAIDEALKKGRAEWELSAAAAQDNLDDEDNIEDNIRDVETQIPAVVGSVDLACRDLGDDVLRLWNDAVVAGNDEEPDPADTAVPDE